MAITKRPSTKTAESFIQAAPDAAEKAVVAKGVMAGHQRQITVAMPPELVDRIDACARKLSITRAAFIKLAISRAIENEG
jgi:hypothetical protein